MDDKELEQRIKLIERDLKQYASRVCTGNNVNEEDLFQDTYLKIWSNKHMYKYDDSFRAWCLRIMHNTFIDTVKVENRYRSIEPPSEYIDVEWYQEKMMKNKDYNLSDSSIDVEDMEESFNLLSKKDKEIVTMFLGGFSQQEIAEKFKMKRNNVKQRFFNAIRLVREDLKEKFNIDETYFSKERLLDIQRRIHK
jgi:RNA polymerase sigma-70 factor (ECF subfamily)